MKKWFLLTCVFAFVGSLAATAQTNGAGAQYWVYNYTNSIKRLDLKITNIKYSPNAQDQAAPLWTEMLESYTTAADTLKGFLVVPQCFGCAGVSETSDPFGDGEGESFIYVIRTGDKTKTVWKSWADVYSGLFNVGVGVRVPDDDDELSADGLPTSKKKLTQAWMSVYFELGDECGVEDALFNNSIGYLPYGPYGFGSDWVDLYHAGFGKAKTITTGGFCSPGGNCFVVTTIAGAMEGWVAQKWVCTAPPIWDVCALTLIDWGTTHGNWQLKLNEAMSNAFNGTLDGDGYITDESDDYMVLKLKGLGFVDCNAFE